MVGLSGKLPGGLYTVLPASKAGVVVVMLVSEHINFFHQEN